MQELKRWLEFRWTWILVAALVILFVLSLSTPDGAIPGSDPPGGDGGIDEELE